MRGSDYAELRAFVTMVELRSLVKASPLLRIIFNQDFPKMSHQWTKIGFMPHRP